jgi:hypothetical protein
MHHHPQAVTSSASSDHLQPVIMYLDEGCDGARMIKVIIIMGMIKFEDDRTG